MALAYKHWARAAALNPSSVLELIAMERVLAAQILSLGQTDHRIAAASAEYPAPTDFRAALVPDSAYLKTLDRIVAEEISTRLATRPVLMANVAALRSLELCIRGDRAPCVALYPRAIAWSELASENPRLTDAARAMLRSSLAKLYAFGGQFEKAVENAQAAARIDSGGIHYLFELAALYLALENLDAAERTIAAAENKRAYSGFRQGVLRDLKHNLERAREDQKRASSTGG